MSRLTAIVIGGGIAGPVTATALRLAGHDATVFEAYPGPTFGLGGSLALAANGLAALDILGVGDAVRSIGLPLHPLGGGAPARRPALPIRRTRMTIGGRTLGELPALTGVEPMRMVDRNT